MINIYSLKTNHDPKVLNSGKWIDGENQHNLVKRIMKYLDVKYVILTNSGTSSLLAAYWALRDEFYTLNVDAYTFPATYQPARILGYKINFVQRGKNTFPDSGLNVITHLFGQPNEIVNKMNPKNFIEDACQAFGTICKGKKAGTIGRIGCFSFYPTKMLHTCGHGGAIATNNKKDYKKMKLFVECGRNNKKMTESPGLNLRIDEIKAEFMLRELNFIEKKIELQRKIAIKLKEFIPSNQPFLTEDTECRHTYSIFNIMVKNRDKFSEFMKKRGIETTVYYNSDILPKTERNRYKDITSSIVSVPCRWNLNRREVNHIKSCLKEWFKNENKHS